MAEERIYEQLLRLKSIALDLVEQSFIPAAAVQRLNDLLSDEKFIKECEWLEGTAQSCEGANGPGAIAFLEQQSALRGQLLMMELRLRMAPVVRALKEDEAQRGKRKRRST